MFDIPSAVDNWFWVHHHEVVDLGRSHEGYRPIASWNNVYAVEKADRMELGLFTGHFPLGKGFRAMTVISDPFFLVMWFCSTHSSFVLAGRIYLWANIFPKVGVMILEGQVEMGSWEKLRIAGMWWKQSNLYMLMLTATTKWFPKELRWSYHRE